MDNSTLVEEIALKCADSDYKDFDKNTYYHALYRATRTIAKRYSLFQKIYNFTLESLTDDIEKDVILELPDFKEEINVFVNESPLIKVATQIELTGQYYLRTIENELHFNYSIVEKSLKDDITIIYNAYPHKESDNEYYIPTKYEEELIRETLLYIAGLGVAKFKGDALEKYKRILELNIKPIEKSPDPHLVENNNWVTMQVYKWWQ